MTYQLQDGGAGRNQSAPDSRIVFPVSCRLQRTSCRCRAGV
jgi:hypothetical protein